MERSSWPIVPVYGTVIHETGTIITDGDGNIIKEAGVHEVTDTESQIFCTALS